MYTYIFYSIIFLVVCLLIYGIWTRRKIYKEIDRLEDWKNEIMKRPITEEIGKVKGLKMSGETEEKFEIWRAKWDEIITVQMPSLEDKLIDIEEHADKYRFNKASQLMKEAHVNLEDIENEIKQLLDDVYSLVNSEEKNREEISEVRKKYFEVRKFFSVHRGSFGKGAAIIEERLEKIYKQFPEFETATEDGNYFEARGILDEIKDETDRIQELMKEIPKYLVQFESHIPSDLKNLQLGLKEMKEDGYAIEHFSIDKDIKRLEVECQKALKKLEVLELDSIESRVNEITEQIDDMYNALEIEVKSKASVLESVNELQIRLENTSERLAQLYLETEHVQQSYRITEEELRYQQQLTKRLNDLIQKLIMIDKAIEEKTQSFTSIYEILVEFNHEYDELEENIEVAANKLSTLRYDELKAKEKLKELKAKLIESKREVQKSNLPGLADSIINEISLSERKVKEAMNRLLEIPLEMDSVSKNVEEAIDLVDGTVDKIKNTIELAELAELVIQYCNRYRNYSREVREQLDEAELAFRSFYYEDAIEIAEDAISPFETSVRKKVKDLVMK